MSRETVFQGNILKLELEDVELPDGTQLRYEMVRHPGGAVIACLNEQSELCLIKQYRHAAGAWIWELPAGLLEPDEPPLETAKRELIEETGTHANDWQELGVIRSTPGFCDELLYLYLAQDIRLGKSALEPGECIEVHWIEFEQAYQWALDGKIDDAKTIVGIFRTKQHLDA